MPREGEWSPYFAAAVRAAQYTQVCDCDGSSLRSRGAALRSPTAPPPPSGALVHRPFASLFILPSFVRSFDFDMYKTSANKSVGLLCRDKIHGAGRAAHRHSLGGSGLGCRAVRNRQSQAL